MSKFKIGDEIQIVTKCEYESQGLRNGKKMKGVITAINEDSYVSLAGEGSYNLKVNWVDGSSNSYCDKHLEMFWCEDFIGTDMNKIQEECKRRYPIGCEFIRCGAVNKTLFTLRADDDTYSIHGKQIYAHRGGSLLYNDGEWAEVVVVETLETTETDSFKSVDMKAIQEECKKRFPIGCTFKVDGGITDTLKQDNTVYVIYENMIYAHSAAGCLYEDGKWATLVSIPDTYSIKSRDEYFPDLSKHIGRYVKVLRYAPNGGLLKVGEYGKIISKSSIDFPNHKGYSAGNALDEGFLNVSYELMRHGFEPLDGEESEELDLIKEAQRRYPIGTKFHPAHMSKDTNFCIVTNTNFESWGDEIVAMTDNGEKWTGSTEGRYGNTCFFRNVYSDGKWAEYYVDPKTDNTSLIVKGIDISGSIKVSNAGIYGAVVWDKEDRKTSISDVLSVDIRLSKKKKKILF